MQNQTFKQLRLVASRPEAREKTVQYLAEHLNFLRVKEKVLLCFPAWLTGQTPYLMEQAVRLRGAEPVIWGLDQRWKTLLRLAFSSHATTIIGPPLIILGIAKLSRHYGTPLRIRNVVTAGYPCLDWMINDIVRCFDCQTWGCFDPGNGAFVAGFSCGKSGGIHLRSELYEAEVVDPQNQPLQEGQIGRIVLWPREDPSLRCRIADSGRILRESCPCGCQSPRLLEMRPGNDLDKDLLNLGQELHSWASILDCRLTKGSYGLELECVVFPGEKLPQLPTCAKRVVRPWDPERDEPFWYIPAGYN